MFDSILSWGSLLLGGSMLGYVAIALLAPSVLSVAAEWLKAMSPLVRGLSEALVSLSKMLWNGIKDILDNVNTILTVVLLVIVALLYGKMEIGRKITCDCETCIENLRKDYKFITRTPQEKKEYLRKKGLDDSFGWTKWFSYGQ